MGVQPQAPAAALRSQQGVGWEFSLKLQLQHLITKAMEAWTKSACWAAIYRVAEWTTEQWKEEVGSKEVAVMTPQILLDALRHAFVTMSAVSLLIFDECHRACGNHPYTRVMKVFYLGSQWRPAVFGMTASPVATEGASTIQDCEAHIAQLELTLDAKVYIIQDRSELERFSPPATIVNKFYDAYLIDFEDLKSKLQTLYEEFDALLVSLEESSPNKFEDTNKV